MKQATRVADVAKHLNLSPGTVSKALNGRYDVSAETRVRVLEAARHLNYPLKSRMRVGTTRVRRIGLVCFSTQAERLFGDHVYGNLIHAIEGEVSAGGDELILELGVRGTPRCKRTGRIHGAIVLGSALSPQNVAALSDVPVVCTPDPVETECVDSVCMDNFGGVRKLTQVLLDQGHRRIGFVAHSDYRLAFVERGSGYALAMHQAGLEAAYITAQGFTQECGEELVEGILAADLTAVVTANDNLAVHLMGRLAAKGVYVPRDISIVGVDNWPQENLLEGLPLTSLDGNTNEVGRQAVRLLRSRIDESNGRRHPLRITVAAELVQGNSVARPRERSLSR